jgi:hypothetical protein
MTYAVRRRLYWLILNFCEWQLLPFVLGIVVGVFISFHDFIEIFSSLDHSGFSLCAVPNDPEVK